ncbi:GMC oxidoreductase [Rhodococcus sp. ARC_M6]|uniref:GMC oxidoreductase n=1 Tax=Rhodococcus sp. ARC_M6 TaxID=2928852 RepID=UPI001FB44FB5|nr:GMC oxidoreductase [Rhodococcus sp. ARC_M6]MCJ0906292.1 GMC oxidoreductase [Rhodococcus sp. ARC_M6]
MQRRNFLKAAGAGATVAATTLTSTAVGHAAPSPQHALPMGSDHYRNLVPELFVPSPPAPAHSEAIVIGSGFGASATALRLAQNGTAVTVLERGLRWPRDPFREIHTSDLLADGRGVFRRTSFTNLTGLPVVCDYFSGVLDATDYENISVWRGAAVGGGSVIFTGVMIAPERRFFDAVFGNSLSYDEMASTWYPKVRQMLRLSPLPEDLYQSANFGHSRRWDQDARRAGFDPQRVDGIWNWDVIRSELTGGTRPSASVGETNMGNSNGAKFDLNQNYIPAAEATGKTTVCYGHQALSIGRERDGRYIVEVESSDPTGMVLSRRTITCDRLFLGAGSIGTSELLVRAQATGALPNLNEHIGKGWGTNGDGAMVRSFGFSDGNAQAAPSASRIVDETGMPLSLENWHVPGVPVNIGLLGSLGMTLDSQRADFTYDAQSNRVVLNWPKNGSAATVEALRAVQNKMSIAGTTLPGALPLAQDVNSSFTAHPLGGAVLGKATDGYGRVKGYDGLYVMDGAAIPGSTGTVNPSLTITALAERNVAEIIRSKR